MTNKAIVKHIEFWVWDIRRSLKFYEGIFEIIGWSLVENNAFGNGETKIYFVEQRVKMQKTTGPRHLCFLANSRKVVDNIGEFLIKNKNEIIRGPMDSQYKNRSSYTIDFRDPDGYVIEVATRSEPKDSKEYTVFDAIRDNGGKGIKATDLEKILGGFLCL